MLRQQCTSPSMAVTAHACAARQRARPGSRRCRPFRFGQLGRRFMVVVLASFCLPVRLASAVGRRGEVSRACSRARARIALPLANASSQTAAGTR